MPAPIFVYSASIPPNPQPKNPKPNMTTWHDSIIRQSDLIGRLVLNQGTAEEMGRIDQLWLDPQAHQIIGFSCKSGILSTKKHHFTWSQIETIGVDSVMVSRLEGLETARPESAIPGVGQEVWADSGIRIGTMIDYQLHPETGEVIEYLFFLSGWRSITEGTYRLPRQAVISMNSKRMIVMEKAAQNAELFSRGLTQDIAQITEFIKEDYAQTQQDLQTLMQNTQSIAEHLKGTLTAASPRRTRSDEPSRQDLSDTDAIDVPSIPVESKTVESKTVNAIGGAPTAEEPPHVEPPPFIQADNEAS